MSTPDMPRIDGIRRVVLLEELHEVDIRPPIAFRQWLAALEQDVIRLLADVRRRTAVACPGCRRDDGVPAFSRFGLDYIRCRTCRSLYVSPRPSEAALETFYTVSEAMAWWYRQFLKDTEPERRDRIFRPRAAWLRGLVEADPGGSRAFVDVQAKYGAFLDEVAKLGVFDRRYVLDPFPYVRDVCRNWGYAELQTVDVGRVSAAAVTALEALERVFDPGALVRTASALLAEGGMLFLTTTSGTGFAVEALGPASPYTLPPIHLNLLSVEGIAHLLRQNGFEIIELSTPGQLDTEIVITAIQEDPTLSLPPIISEIIRHRGPEVHQAFQQFLQEARLSSHVRIAAQKSGGHKTA